MRRILATLVAPRIYISLWIVSFFAAFLLGNESSVTLLLAVALLVLGIYGLALNWPRRKLKFVERLGLIFLIGLSLVAGGVLDLLIVLGIERLQGPVNRLNKFLGRYADEKAKLDAEREKARAARQHRA